MVFPGLGKDMKPNYSATFIALVLAPTLALSAATQLIATDAARAGEGTRYDRNIERAAARIVAEKLGELRGGFSHDVNVDMVTIAASTEKPELAPGAEDAAEMPPEPMREPAPFPSQRIMQRENALPPIVIDETPWGDYGVDPVMTGGTDRVTWLSAGDVEFMPPKAPPLTR